MSALGFHLFDLESILYRKEKNNLMKPKLSQPRGLRETINWPQCYETETRSDLVLQLQEQEFEVQRLDREKKKLRQQRNGIEQQEEAVDKEMTTLIMQMHSTAKKLSALRRWDDKFPIPLN